MRKLPRIAATATAGVALAASAALASPALAATPAAGDSIGISCEWVEQYRVHTDGDMTDQEWGGNPIGWAWSGDTFNVRYKGYPRYWGKNAANGKWGWILASKLTYVRTTCV